MLTISKISKAYGGRTLFSDVSLQVNRKDRIGLVGPNGAGKSTFFSLVLKENTPDDGSISFEKNVSIGFLPQETAPIGDESILELATAISPEMEEVRRIMAECEKNGEDDSEKYHQAQAKFIECDGFQLEAKAKRILNGLAFKESDFEREARTMSGGWVMRAHLARLLVMEPDLLMLDEPTNHLDLESLVWFQEYLKNYPGAILMISHDRSFLNALVSSVIDIKHGRLSRYRGNYDDYVQQVESRDAQHLAAYKNQQKEIKALQDFANRFRAKASKASQAQAKLKQIDRMEKIEAPVQEQRSIKFQFPQPQRSGQRVMALKNIHQAYGDLKVYEDLNLEVEKGQKTVLVGPNGAGKSTLIKILAGLLDFQKGERVPGHNVEVGYYSQNRVDMLDSNNEVLREVMNGPNPVAEETARTILGSFLFRGDDVFKKISVLSGGEKSRLALVKILLNPPNLLLMDEPTTHLDMGSIDALIGALRQYEGTLIFISHDVYFIRALAKTVWHVHSGSLTPYAGDYQYYLEKSKARSEKEALVAGGSNEQEQIKKTVEKSGEGGKGEKGESSRKKTKEQKRLEAEERQRLSKLRNLKERRIEQIETEIEELEGRQNELTEALQKKENYDDAEKLKEMNMELAEVVQRLERLMTEWDQVSDQLVVVEKQ